jgi:predicted RNase H-like nuclease (RuvC/YqgF family)
MSPSLSPLSSEPSSPLPILVEGYDERPTNEGEETKENEPAAACPSFEGKEVSLRKQITQLETVIHQLQVKNAQLQGHLSSMKTTVQSTRHFLEEMQQNVNESSSIIKELEEKNQRLVTLGQALHDQNKALIAILNNRAKEQSGCCTIL